MIGYCLTVGDFEAWTRFSIVAIAQLNRSERAALAYAALGALPPETAVEAAATALGARGEPLPPFLGGMTDARGWAARATKAELQAYALAAFDAMEPKDQAAFYHHISEIEVAA